MERYRAEIEVPENASWQTIEDAKIKAPWHKVVTKDDRMKRTDLCNKCGSCKYFVPIKFFNSKSCGNCLKGYTGSRPRSQKACKAYERVDHD